MHVASINSSCFLGWGRCVGRWLVPRRISADWRQHDRGFLHLPSPSPKRELGKELRMRLGSISDLAFAEETLDLCNVVIGNNQYVHLTYCSWIQTTSNNRATETL